MPWPFGYPDFGHLHGCPARGLSEFLGMDRLLACWLVLLLGSLGTGVRADSFSLPLCSRVPSTPGQSNWTVMTKTATWDPTRTAVVICDMWDKHHCPDATERVGEMAPRMNELVKFARAQGALIIHCPSDTMDFYQDHPGRKLAQAAPKVETAIPLEGWCSLKPDREAPLPIDDSDGGCDGCPDCPSYKAWTRQHPALEILPGDAVTDSAEAYYLMRQRGITNVMVMGVHINMCVLGRPFSIRQMVRQGQNVVLVRDLTDSMYNHRKAPYVSHFRGTELVVEHIEKYWCPSITSADLLGGEPFRFRGDVKKEVCFIIGENEYHTWETLPEFAQSELAWRGYRLSFVTASEKVDDNDFKNWEAIRQADLVVVSTRRRTPPKPLLDALRAHLAAGKPLVGIRTASHGFELRDQKTPTDTTWPNFDTEILGGDYQDHYGKGPGKITVVKAIPETAGNPILNNVSPEFRSESHLYRSRNLFSTVTPLLQGQTEDGKSAVEPVAWINTRENRRVFYTSLGGPEDFADPNFRRLLLNGMLWAMNDFIPPAQPRPVDYPGAWQPLKVPGTWDEMSQNRLAAFDGVGWYRCWVKVPADWPADGQAAVEQVDDAFEMFVDGTKVGAGGTFPPNYSSGLGPERSFPVKLRPGQWTSVAVRVYDAGGRGGFKGRAPELRAGGQTLQLAGDWEFRTGDQSDWARPATPAANASGPGILAAVRAEAASAAAPAPTAEQLGPLTPAESAQSFEVFDDLVFEQVLAEPTIAQPVFLTFDERGRMWVVEYRQYPSPAGLKMVSRDNFWRAVYDQVPQPPPHHVRGADRITIHEDSNGDGTLDRHTTFVDGLNIATSVAFGRGGVFVLNPPYLLFYPDANRDDVPDGDPQVLLSGFGLEDTHSVANSLRWGPDGWLYGCQGSTVTGNILVYGADGKVLTAEQAVASQGLVRAPTDPARAKEPMRPVYSQGQNIWRYHPGKRIYEVFSEGGGNAFGLEIDSAGRVFSGHNGGNTRGFHYQQGAYLQKGFDKHGPLSNPYAFGYFPQMPHPDVDRFTHNFVIYDSGALGERYQGKLFGVEPLQGRIVLSEIVADGSTFRTRDLGYPVKSRDKWFRPVDIKVGPDGAIYVCDWYDRQVNHYRNHEGQIDQANGRIYRLRAKGPDTRAVASDLSRASAAELAALLNQPNRTRRQEALRLLADRGAQGATPALKERLAGPDASAALEALWALYQSGPWDAATQRLALTSKFPQVRLWVVRLVGDERRVDPDQATFLASLSAAEPDLEVRAQLASTAGRLPAAAALPVIKALLSHDADARDPRQPLLVWWALETQCGSHRDELLALFSDRELWRAPIVQNAILSRLMRRLASTGKREDLLACARLFELSPGADQTAQLTKGFEEAYQGRPLAGLPEELLNAMEKAGGESLVLGARRGKPGSVAQALKVVADPAASSSQRLQLISVLGEARQPSAIPVLLAVARDAKSSDLRRAALGALQGYDSPEIAGEVLTQLATYPADVRASAWALLASRPTWAKSLLQAVQSGQVPQKSVPPETVRQLLKLGGASGGNAELQARVTKLWPSMREATSAEKEEEIARLAEVINLSTGSPYVGKKLYLENCGVCHRLFGKGAEIGPDLTVYQRSDLPNLLLNIVNPGAEIREGYESFSAETRDGRLLTGFLADQDARMVVLRTPDGQTVPLARSDLASLEPAGASLMPEGLLGGLSDQQIRDLFAYLRSTQPLNDGN